MAQKPKTKPEAREPVTMELTSVTHMKSKDASGSFPMVRFEGDKPIAGDTLLFVLGNSIAYRGIVASVTTEGKEHLVRFAGGIEARSVRPIRRKGIKVIGTTTLQRTEEIPAPKPV